LVADLVAIRVEATIKPEVREVVEAVGALLKEGQEEVRQAELKSVLQLDKSAVSRRVADAIDAGFLRNLEDRKGRPARLVMGELLPDNCEVLPTREQLDGSGGLRGCTVESGDKPPLLGAEQDANLLGASRWEVRL
jgi:MarR family